MWINISTLEIKLLKSKIRASYFSANQENTEFIFTVSNPYFFGFVEVMEYRNSL